MKKTTIATLVAAAMTSATPAFATDVAKELAAMKARIAQLEAQLAAQQATTQKLEQKTEAQTAVTASNGGFAENVSVGGEVTLLAQQVETDGENSVGDVLVDTFELEIAADINENVKVATLIEYLSADEKLDLAEAYVVIGSEDNPLSFTLGKTAHPILVGDSAAFTDPIAFDIFDAKEGLAMLSYQNEMIQLDTYVLNNSAEGNEGLDTFGLNLGTTFSNGVSLGAGYVTDVANTAGPFSELGGLTEKIDAWRVNALVEAKDLALFAEYIQLGKSNLAGEPSFLHLGAGYGTQILGADGTLFLGYSESDEAEDIDNVAGIDYELPEKRVALGVTRSLGENAEVTAEYVREEAYNDTDSDILNVAVTTTF